MSDVGNVVSMGGGHEKKGSGCKTAWQIDILAEENTELRGLLWMRASRLLQSCSKPLFQRKAKCEAIHENDFYILLQIKLIFTREVFLLASFYK